MVIQSKLLAQPEHCSLYANLPRLQASFYSTIQHFYKKKGRIPDLKSSESLSTKLKLIPIAHFSDGEANPEGNNDPKHVFLLNNFSEFSAQL